MSNRKIVVEKSKNPRTGKELYKASVDGLCDYGETCQGALGMLIINMIAHKLIDFEIDTTRAQSSDED